VHAYTAIIARPVTDAQLIAWIAHLAESGVDDAELRQVATQNAAASLVDAVLEHARRRHASVFATSA